MSRVKTGVFSERKAQAIYDAVHEALMPLRIRNEKHVMLSGELGGLLATAQHQAAMAAVAAYRKPLKGKARLLPIFLLRSSSSYRRRQLR